MSNSRSPVWSLLPLARTSAAYLRARSEKPACRHISASPTRASVLVGESNERRSRLFKGNLQRADPAQLDCCDPQLVLPARFINGQGALEQDHLAVLHVLAVSDRFVA